MRIVQEATEEEVAAIVAAISQYGEGYYEPGELPESSGWKDSGKGEAAGMDFQSIHARRNSRQKAWRWVNPECLFRGVQAWSV